MQGASGKLQGELKDTNDVINHFNTENDSFCRISLNVLRFRDTCKEVTKFFNYYH